MLLKLALKKYKILMNSKLPNMPNLRFCFIKKSPSQDFVRNDFGVGQNTF